MAREYRYRRHLHWGQYGLPILFGLMAVGPWVALALLVRVGSTEVDEGFVVVPVMSLICLAVGGWSWWMYYRLAGVSVNLEEDALVYNSRGGAKRLSYGRLLPLRFSSVPYIGGWVILCSGADKFA